MNVYVLFELKFEFRNIFKDMAATYMIMLGKTNDLGISVAITIMNGNSFLPTNSTIKIEISLYNEFFPQT